MPSSEQSVDTITQYFLQYCPDQNSGPMATSQGTHSVQIAVPGTTMDLTKTVTVTEPPSTPPVPLTLQSIPGPSAFGKCSASHAGFTKLPEGKRVRIVDLTMDDEIKVEVSPVDFAFDAQPADSSSWHNKAKSFEEELISEMHLIIILRRQMDVLKKENQCLHKALEHQGGDSSDQHSDT
ncbi:hypothetical protein DACRYDRAFT_17238 [Dacryopinax primogenitus]|uniref:Uncharacterized protein n=1 Tax=Dacryopinax primogenitus (strain DJM 731) TaxID=1858805 RepID=M5FR56_DACPD|nr:uncharacterized protein DACRYDRAFT_17238 [Dacryopinax primogenitus]EJT99555.1 hypothetical protein DACRYDRAFT_17238 [Dacryopinax primogenitus]